MYRAAIVGAGAPIARANSNLEGYSIGYNHARGYLAHPDVEVVAIADIRHENAQALSDFVGGAQAFTSLTALLSATPVDILSVCTWPTLHCEMVLEAIAAGVKIILCEKPMAVSLEEIDAMVSAASEAGARLFVNHQRRYEQPYRGARRLIEDGVLGEVLRIEGYVGDGWDLMSWGSHWVDMSRYFAGEKNVSWVLAATESTGKVRYGHLVEDQMLLQFAFEDGPLALVHTGPHTTGAGLIVTGSAGTLRMTFEGSTLALSTRDADAVLDEYLQPDDGDGFVLAIADIIGSTSDGTNSLIDGASGHADTEIMLAAYESARTSGIVRLPLADRSMTLRPAAAL